MRKWYVPLTVLGLGSLSALFLTDKGRQIIRFALDRLDEAPERWSEWNEAAQAELDRIQSALNHVAETLETAH